jgi:hypothetical protein
MIDGFRTAALRRQRSRELLMSPQVRHLLEQSERAFRLARAMTNRADAEGLGQVGRLFLDEARRLAAEEGEPIKRVPR